jgi:hypothetical protein
LAFTALAAIKQGVAFYKDAKAAGSDVTKIAREISGYIGNLFDSQEQVKQTIEEQKKNPPKNKSLKAQALDNIINQIELERQVVELREFLIYHVDPELGAVWSRFEEEYARLQEEQEQARLIAEHKAREAAWQRRQLISSLQDKALQIGAVTLVTIYLLLLFWVITIDRKVRWDF